MMYDANQRIANGAKDRLQHSLLQRQTILPWHVDTRVYVIVSPSARPPLTFLL